eukprot:3767973-Alexandrium_andersonii.AAC.1
MGWHHGRALERWPCRSGVEASPPGLPRPAHAHPGVHGGIERRRSGQLAEVRPLLGGEWPALGPRAHLRTFGAGRRGHQSLPSSMSAP